MYDAVIQPTSRKKFFHVSHCHRFEKWTVCLDKVFPMYPVIVSVFSTWQVDAPKTFSRIYPAHSPFLCWWLNVSIGVSALKCVLRSGACMAVESHSRNWSFCHPWKRPSVSHRLFADFKMVIRWGITASPHRRFHFFHVCVLVVHADIENLRVEMASNISLTYMREGNIIRWWIVYDDIHFLIIGFIVLEKTQGCAPQPRQHACRTCLQLPILRGSFDFICDGRPKQQVISAKTSFVSSGTWIFLHYPRTENVEQGEHSQHTLHRPNVSAPYVNKKYTECPGLELVLYVSHTVLPECTIHVVGGHVGMWLCISKPGVVIRN